MVPYHARRSLIDWIMQQMIEGLGTTSCRRPWHVLMAVQLLAFAVLGCYRTWSQEHLYADGAHYFLGLLEHRAVADWYSARQFAFLVTQWPTVFLLRDLGCRDINLVCLTYGATLFLLPLIGILPAWWAARRAPGEYLVYPILSQSMLFLDTSFFIISETHVAAAIFWPLLYLLLFSERWTMGRAMLLIGLAVLATRMYESYLFLAWPLLFVAWRRGQSAWSAGRRADSLICGVCGLLFLTGFAVALYFTIFPRDPFQQGIFAVSLLAHVAYPPVWFSLLSLAGVLWCLLFPERRCCWRMMHKLTIGCGLFVALLPICGFVVPGLQFVARVQSLYLPLVLGGLAIMRYYDKLPPTTTNRSVELFRLASWACAVAVVFQSGAVAQWNGYRSILSRELARNRGVIDYDESAMAGPMLEKLVEREYVSYWLCEFAQHPGNVLKQLELAQFNFGIGGYMPSLSVALSALNLGEVTTIINSPDSLRWQAFDARDLASIPDLREYGVPTVLDQHEGPDS